jgi:hypothetical protein
MKYGRRKTNEWERSFRRWVAVLLVLSSVLPHSSFVLAAPGGAAFLKIGAGARAVGMGSAFTAAADDVTAMHWNPAGLARLGEPQISATHGQWLSDLRYGAVSAATPVLLWTAGVGVVYLSQGEMDRRDAAGNRDGSFRADDMAATVSLSRILRPGLGVGVNLKYVQQTIAEHKASGLAFDVGSQWILSRRLALGLSAQNAGSKMKFVREEYDLPLTVSGGAAFSPFSGLTVSGDLRHDVHGRESVFSLGTEFWAMSTIALRAGYNTPFGGTAPSVSRPGEKPGVLAGASDGMGVGIGLRLFGSQMDYALVPYGSLGDTHRLTFTHRF